MIVRSGMGAIERRRTTIQGIRRLALAVSSRRRGLGQLAPDPSTMLIDPSATLDVLDQIDATGGPIPPAILPTSTPPSLWTGGSSSWAQALQSLIPGALSIIKTATLPTGAYTTSYVDPRTGQVVTTMANQVPGALPGGGVPFLGSGTSSFGGLGLVLLLGVGVVVVLAISSGGRR